MAEVLRACVLANANGFDGPLGGLQTEAHRKNAEATHRSRQSTPGNRDSVLASGGGGPSNFGTAAPLRWIGAHRPPKEIRGLTSNAAVPSPARRGDLAESVEPGISGFRKCLHAVAAQEGVLLRFVPDPENVVLRHGPVGAGKTLVELSGLAGELNAEAEGIEIEPSPTETDHSAVFAQPIDDLDLSARTYNCLKRDGVHTVGDVIARTESDLSDIRNFGQKSIDEVKVKLHQLGLSLKGSPDPSEVPGYDVATGTWSANGG